MELEKAKQVIAQVAANIAAYDPDKDDAITFYEEAFKPVKDIGEDPYEGTLTEWADDAPALMEPLRELLKTMIDTFNGRGVIWVNDEMHAGQWLAEYLATKNKDDIALFNDYMGSMDLDHAVDVGQMIKSVCDAWKGEPEVEELEDALDYFREVEGLEFDDDDEDDDEGDE